MNKKTAERCMLAALIALVIYGLACIYPAAWSPDSKRVVFPVFRKVGGDTVITALVMSDLEGKAIRDVASVEPGKAQLGAASWSPDGRWIAYMKREEIAAATAPTASAPGQKIFLLSLMLQDAAGGAEKCLLKKQVLENTGGFSKQSMGYGPAWLADSKTLAVCMDDSLCAFLDLEGKATKEIPLGEKRIPASALISPDGRHLVFLTDLDEKAKTGKLWLMEADTAAVKLVDNALVPDGEFLSPLAWSPDSQSFYYAGVAERDKKQIALLRKFDLAKGGISTVREGSENMIWGISLSRSGDMLAVDFSVGDHNIGIEMVNPLNGEATPLHFAAHFSTALSPDGKWVALVEGMDDSNGSVGWILSSDGKEMRFFLYRPEWAKRIPELLFVRLMGAMGYAESKGELSIEKLTPVKVEQVDALVKAMDEFGATQKTPLMKEAADFGKVFLIVDGISKAEPAAKEALADAARKEMNVFLKAYPKYPLGDFLREGIEDALKSKSAPATKPAAGSSQPK